MMLWVNKKSWIKLFHRLSYSLLRLKRSMLRLGMVSFILRFKTSKEIVVSMLDLTIVLIVTFKNKISANNSLPGGKGN